MIWRNLIWLAVLLAVSADPEILDGSYVSEQRGYFKREHSFFRPYQGAGMDVPYWDIVGSTMVSSQQIRLTPNLQGRQGSIWNVYPVQSRDWEFVVNFKIHGDTGKLFGDGFAIWYVRDRNQIGEVFGSKNYFSGLGVFVDTYSNEYKSYAHTFPYVYAMVSNGSVAYDSGTDGAETQLGGKSSGCELKLRNKEHDTQLLIRYVGDTLSIFEDTEDLGRWKQCLSVAGVHLPTNYYLGMSSATGDLSDNHDIISAKLYEIEFARAESEREVNAESILPNAESEAAPRDQQANPQPSKLSSWGKYFLIFLGVAATLGGVAVFGYLYYQDRQARSRKRFY